MINERVYQGEIQSSCCGKHIICVTSTALTGEQCCRQRYQESGDTEITVVQSSLTSKLDMQAQNHLLAELICTPSLFCQTENHKIKSYPT